MQIRSYIYAKFNIIQKHFIDLGDNMKIEFNIDYKATWGQSVYICLSGFNSGHEQEASAIKLECVGEWQWQLLLDVNKSDYPDANIQYRYLVKENDLVVKRESGEPHLLNIQKNLNKTVYDIWKDVSQASFLYSSPFKNSFAKHSISAAPVAKEDKNTVILQVIYPLVKKDEELLLCGDGDLLGNWQAEAALRLEPVSFDTWQIALDREALQNIGAFKFAIYNKLSGQIVSWEEGDNRQGIDFDTLPKGACIKELVYRTTPVNWKAAGVSIPVFSLRSETSFGIGEFTDLPKLIDWAVAAEQQVIQILPINDTTITHTWTDSYPYNAISIFALHPIYLGLSSFSLKDKALQLEFTKRGTQLNALPQLDYEKVLKLKTDYLDELYKDEGDKIMSSKEYVAFYEENKHWLFSYAVFCFLRDKFQTADYTQWGEYKTYNLAALEKAVLKDKQMKAAVDKSCMIQFLLHTQLSQAKDYANNKGVVLKGDIPIGISRCSNEAWVEPHLFNLDTFTGAPPDGFSANGQNWGFPTYNWQKMSENDYQWWVKRFKKMADYFDAYRIDHILGFFRIWEIPVSSVQGLLGYFSPAMPFSHQEIAMYGFWDEVEPYAHAFIYESELDNFFGQYKDEVFDAYLEKHEAHKYRLKEFCNTQQKIKAIFDAKEPNEKNDRIREALYGFCNEVLFVKDKNDPSKYHPRISVHQTRLYHHISWHNQQGLNKLYNHYFYHRHNDFWKHQAMQKLPLLIHATDMLVCGEDLGMIPSCVHPVMNDLQILTLEIQRMPKKVEATFEDLQAIPYLSVCTTSTHDMSPIRMWWEEDRGMTQRYYNEVLKKEGAATETCLEGISYDIVENHVSSNAMLVILPLQDWLAIDEKLRNPDANAERINIPANPQHNWNYRMHLNLESLLQETAFNNRVGELVRKYNRGS